MNAALDLLSEAHQSLRQDLAPALGGEARLSALLAANAVATARREVALCARLAAAAAELPRDPEAIRSGAHDDDVETYKRILAVAVLRAHVADPSAVTEDERRTWIGEADE
ncbi:MAG TPA: hypothetical protein VLA66_02545 [Thermoanaerobaculia bacterium]|nr:hypothetical protein [Thermoanaerobaculia bacterium]